MSLQSTFRAGLASIVSQFGDSAVTIIDASGAQAQGVRGTIVDTAEWGSAGVAGQARGAFVVSAETMTFARGNIITVAGDRATVDSARLDGVGAYWHVEWTKQT